MLVVRTLKVLKGPPAAQVVVEMVRIVLVVVKSWRCCGPTSCPWLVLVRYSLTQVPMVRRTGHVQFHLGRFVSQQRIVVLAHVRRATGRVGGLKEKYVRSRAQGVEEVEGGSSAV